MITKPAEMPKPAATDPTEYDEEVIPFDVVICKLANTKPPNKAVETVQPKPKKTGGSVKTKVIVQVNVAYPQSF